jgi:uncharacterized protein YifN (PemK superfamily)
MVIMVQGNIGDEMTHERIVILQQPRLQVPSAYILPMSSGSGHRQSMQSYENNICHTLYTTY